MCSFKEEHIIFTYEIIKIELQLCVILSQNGKHKLAIQTSDSAIHRLFECFDMLMAMVN